MKPSIFAIDQKTVRISYDDQDGSGVNRLIFAPESGGYITYPNGQTVHGIYCRAEENLIDVVRTYLFLITQ